MPISLLWLPILLSAVFNFVVSSILHMAVPWHRSDYPRMPNEDGVLDALRPLAIPPGDYMVPRPAGMDDMRSPQFAEKMQKGPVIVMTVMPNGQTSMGRNLGMWFAYLLVIAFFVAALAAATLGRGAHGRDVFHLTGGASLLGYAAALWQMSIWYRRSWLTTIKSTVDGIIYAAVTAATFMWLWPA
jgi:hypothetical protein